MKFRNILQLPIRFAKPKASFQANSLLRKKVQSFIDLYQIKDDGSIMELVNTINHYRMLENKLRMKLVNEGSRGLYPKRSFDYDFKEFD